MDAPLVAEGLLPAVSVRRWWRRRWGRLHLCDRSKTLNPLVAIFQDPGGCNFLDTPYALDQGFVDDALVLAFAHVQHPLTF